MPVQQVPWKSVYLAGGLLIAGACSWRLPCQLSWAVAGCRSRSGWPDIARAALAPHATSPPAAAATCPPDCSAARPADDAAQAAPLLRPSSTTHPAGLTMFISGMVLWQTEGAEALIGLWVLGLLVFIPGFYFTCAAWQAAVQFLRCISAAAGLILSALPCPALPSPPNLLGPNWPPTHPPRFPCPPGPPGLLSSAAGVLPTWCTAGAGATPGTTSPSSPPCPES